MFIININENFIKTLPDFQK